MRNSVAILSALILRGSTVLLKLLLFDLPILWLFKFPLNIIGAYWILTQRELFFLELTPVDKSNKQLVFSLFIYRVPKLSSRGVVMKDVARSDRAGFKCSGALSWQSLFSAHLTDESTNSRPDCQRNSSIPVVINWLRIEMNHDSKMSARAWLFKLPSASSKAQRLCS